jgi:hypothetical protein
MTIGALLWSEDCGATRRELERETGIEPATNGLGSRDSTTELLPLSVDEPSVTLAQFGSQFVEQGVSSRIAFL